MQINVKGHGLQVTPALRDHAIARFERLSRYLDDVHGLDVVLNVEKHVHKAEATAQLSGCVLHAQASADDMYAAIDGLSAKMEQQVRKEKGKRADVHADAVRSTRYG